MMKKVSLLLTLILVLIAVAPVLAANPFTDVPAGHWAYEAVSKVSELGIMEGTPQGEFNGKESVSRYRMAIITARIINQIEKKENKLDEQKKQEVKDIVSKLEQEFEEELELIQSDIETLHQKSDENKNLSITAILLSLIAIGAAN
ncbi:MAG: S-layer homology domain-containing protein [Bacillota bacterium]